ncbi:ankyrin [Piromyces finnis]|uniref:Ankyrin n=1 Tax=Piromyces finnis TaxID=1754191 RepID=A0A1Y1UUM2_9FUNG|nr:ankyrin [Piromyces finnis]|eukprot:ORX41735.1 ankyrin [Piromyces finnis]
MINSGKPLQQIRSNIATCLIKRKNNKTCHDTRLIKRVKETPNKQEQKLMNIIRSNNVAKLERYLKKHNIILNEIMKATKLKFHDGLILSTNFNPLLISLEQKCSVDMIEYIVNKCQFEQSSNKTKICYLAFALYKNNFEGVNVLLKYNIELKDNIIILLYNLKILNEENLNFILDKGIDICYINDFLDMLANKGNISSNDIKYICIIVKNKDYKISIDEELYVIAIALKNDDLLRNLFFNDNSDKFDIIHKINKYKLLEEVLDLGIKYNYRKKNEKVKNNFFEFLKKILNYKEAFTYQDLVSEENIRKMQRIDISNIMKLIIDTSLDIFLKAKEEVNKENYFKYINTIFSRAIENSYIKLIEYLLLCIDHKKILNIDDATKNIINFVDYRNSTPLKHAIKYSSYEVAKYLIDHKADMEHINKGESALMYSIKLRNIEITKLLIESGANVNYVQEETGMSVLMYSIKFKNLKIIKLLIESGANVNYVQEETGISVLMYSIEFENQAITKLLIESGANVNYVQEETGISVLMYSIKFKNLKIIKLLIESGADVNFNLKNNKSLLMHVIDLASDKVFKDEYICDYECNLNDGFLLPCEFVPIAPNEKFLFPSEKSYKFCYKNLLSLLINNNANIDYIYINMNTPKRLLTYTIENHKYEIAKYLIKCGADVFAEDENDNILTDLINNINKLEDIKNEDSSDYDCNISTYIDLFKFIVRTHFQKHNPDIFQKYMDYGILELIIQNGQEELLKILVDNKFNCTTTDKNNKTIFHYAVENKQKNILDYLMHTQNALHMLDDLCKEILLN